MRWKTILIAAGILGGTICSATLPAQFEHNIVLEPLFVDSEHNFGVGLGDAQNPGMSVRIYYEEGFSRQIDYIGGINTSSGHDPGTFYVYRYQAAEMGGAAMGYNHVGNGAFFRPTITVPASQVPEILWFQDSPISPNVITVESEPFIADRGDVPSIALSQDFTGGVLNGYSGVMSATYLAGNVLFPGSDYHVFAKGGVDFSMNGYWGDIGRPVSSHEVNFSLTPADGPMRVTLGADGYTTTTLSLTAHAKHAYDYQNLLVATTGKSASQYLEQIGWEPSPPPVWVKKMALEEKLTGKTKWLYPPLTRHADANGDGVYDAADLAAIYSSKKKAPN